MAYADYIHCPDCDCKLVYDGSDSHRDWLRERFEVDQLLCPSCAAKLRAEVEALTTENERYRARIELLLAVVEVNNDRGLAAGRE